MDIVDKIQELISGKATFASLEKELGIGNGTIGKWRKQSPSCDSIMKIANHLDCSVDYLLGRTNDPTSHKSASSVSVGNVQGNSGAIGVGNTVTNSAAPDKQEAALLEVYKRLTPLQQAKLLVYADELTKGEMQK